MRNEQQACFDPFCSCGTSSRCGLPADSMSSMSWQHSTSQCSIRGKVLPAEAQRRSGCHLSCPLPRPIHYHVSKLGSSPVPVAADSAEACPYSAGREKVKLCVWFLPWESLGCVGEQNSSAVGALMALR